jgi:hypothetical protein
VNKLQPGVKEKNEKTHCDGEVQIVFVRETERRKGAEQNVPDGAAAHRGDETQDDDAQ